MKTLLSFLTPPPGAKSFGGILKLRTMPSKNDFEWELPQPQGYDTVSTGDVRVVNLPVQVVFTWSDEIVADYDSETDEILEYTSGYVMEVIPGQRFVYKGEETVFLFQAWEAQNKEADQIVNKKYARKTTVSEKPGKEVYYFTFGQDHVHPRGGYPMKDYWVEAEGDWTEARTKMFAKYGDKWSMQYAAEDFEPELFPKGCHEKL